MANAQDTAAQLAADALAGLGIDTQGSVQDYVWGTANLGIAPSNFGADTGILALLEQFAGSMAETFSSLTGPMPSAAPTSELDKAKENADAYALMQDYLSQWGLGTLGKWAWEQIQKGKSNAEILLELRKQPEYQARFPAMAALEKQGVALSPREYVELEQGYRQMFKAAGLPPGFYDKNEDFTDLIANNLSPNEVAQRISQGYQKVAQTAPEVRAAFKEYFGVSGDSALAAYYLDPEKSAPVLIRQAETATVGGVASRWDVDLGRGKASKLASMGVDADQAQAGFQKVAELAPVFAESVDETKDFTAAEHGTNAVFGLNAQAGAKIERRIASRNAAFGGGGGAAQTRAGTGFGSADA